MKEKIKVGDYIRVTKTDYMGELEKFLLNNDVQVVKVLNKSKLIVDIKTKLDLYEHTTWTVLAPWDTYHKVEVKP